ncbi:MAG: uncharacterized protein KVP18_002474 [Porospora cf. gigantea A]|uniref:uncharacterized protein n=1 Tax=Porospora cf. gigantea A TaxID=2853593 RepID=UPI00355A3579|nr:MAG: hypothetical protein KVP18_002474 [Porospora cf. gigantea A]
MAYIRQRDAPGATVFLLTVYLAFCMIFHVGNLFVNHTWLMVSLGIRGSYDSFEQTLSSNCASTWIHLRWLCEKIVFAFTNKSFRETVEFVCGTELYLSWLLEGCDTFEADYIAHWFQRVGYLSAAAFFAMAGTCLIIYWSTLRIDRLRRSVLFLILMGNLASLLGLGFWVTISGPNVSAIFSMQAQLFDLRPLDYTEIDSGFLMLVAITASALPLPALAYVTLKPYLSIDRDEHAAFIRELEREKLAATRDPNRHWVEKFRDLLDDRRYD